MERDEAFAALDKLMAELQDAGEGSEQRVEAAAIALVRERLQRALLICQADMPDGWTPDTVVAVAQLIASARSTEPDADW